MKIQCDVCNKDQASVYCTADEAALCDGCDHRVHHANKLAGKHQRFSLLHPSPKQTPLCDICQEKRGFLFCQQDRAILCLGCDIPIHKANEHTQNHNRFLLTGVKLSVTSSLYSSSSSSSESLNNNGGCDGVPRLSIKSVNEPVSVTGLIPNPTQKITSSGDTDKDGKNNQAMNEVGNGSTSSISEYLIEMLPGWHVEDFLDSSSTPSGFSKSGENDLLSFWDADLEGNLGSFSSENMGFLVPQAPPMVHLSQPCPASNMALGGSIDLKDSKEATNMVKSSRKWRDNGCLNVPQISPPYTSSKR